MDVGVGHGAAVVRHLADVQCAVGELEYDVGEGAADIDPDARTPRPGSGRRVGVMDGL